MSGFEARDGSQFSVGGSPNQGVLLQRRDQGWAVQHETDEMLHWIHGVDADIWSVGASGKVLRLSITGGTPVEVSVGTDLDLWGVWAFSETDVWVVGGDPRAAGQTSALILHYDGHTWQNIPLPDLDRPCPSLFKVWGKSPQSVYFVGANGTLLHWNGQMINQIELNIGDDLVALWGEGDRIVVVGGRIRGVFVLFDGADWQTVLLPRTSGLNGIWLSGDTAIAVGQRGMIVDLNPRRPQDSTITQPTETLLHGIFGSPTHGLFAVGGTLDQPLPWSPLLLEGDLP